MGHGDKTSKEARVLSQHFEVLLLAVKSRTDYWISHTDKVRELISTGVLVSTCVSETNALEKRVR